MPVVTTKGSASSQGFGEFAQSATSANYIEDVFSTYLYTGTSATNTITNGIDLSTKGGMTWIKKRNSATNSEHVINDTSRGAGYLLFPNLTSAQIYRPTSFTSFNNNGFTLGVDDLSQAENYLNDTYASWTFRKQAKFFDVVTYTGNGANRTIAHNLGSVPGFIIVKRTDTTAEWKCYHRSLGGTYQIVLNDTAAASLGSNFWNNTDPTSSVFSVGTNASVNANGGTYVAYLFAHDAGGFGTSGTDNVISCGSFTTDGSGNATVSLGYEPQWVLYKGADLGGSNWTTVDIMRKFTTGGADSALYPNTSAAESNLNSLAINSTGFSTKANLTANTTYIYIAIRRGPMKTPTDGTTVFKPIFVNAPTDTQQTTNFPVNLQIAKATAISDSNYVIDRLRGVTTTSTGVTTPFLLTESTAIESTSSSISNNWNNTGFAIPSSWASTNYVFWSFNRAPGFFDEVCYTGTGSNQNITHNLNAVPQLMLVKQRTTTAQNWQVYSASLANTQYLLLNTSAAAATGTTRWNSTTPTSSVFTVGTSTTVNTSGENYVAYLFGTVSGVSKVGSYTGTGSTQTINCGFTGGARFVLIKRTDSTGRNWWVWDTARGMVAGTDPRLALNSTIAQTNANWVYTATTGFQIVTSDAEVNANGGTYIYLAIA